MTDTVFEHSDKPVYKLKCVVVGDLGVGKTTLVRSFAEDKGAKKLATVPRSMWKKEISLDSYVVCLTIWDTAGQERYRSLTGSYYRGAHCCIIVFDVHDLASFQNVIEWFNSIDENSTNSNEVMKILVGTKRKKSKREVSLEKAESLADHLGVPYKEICFENQKNIRELFETLAGLTVLLYQDNDFHSEIPMILPHNPKKKSFCACG